MQGGAYQSGGALFPGIPIVRQHLGTPLPIRSPQEKRTYQARGRSAVRGYCCWFIPEGIPCRLQTLEWLVLRRRRERADDLPGAEIPARYQSYLRTGDPAALRAVVEHNRRDVISTASLLC